MVKRFFANCPELPAHAFRKKSPLSVVAGGGLGGRNVSIEKKFFGMASLAFLHTNVLQQLLIFWLKCMMSLLEDTFLPTRRVAHDFMFLYIVPIYIVLHSFWAGKARLHCCWKVMKGNRCPLHFEATILPKNLTHLEIVASKWRNATLLFVLPTCPIVRLFE